MMKAGKIPENILKRSVIKRIHTKNKKALITAGVGNDTSVIKIPSECSIAASDRTQVIVDEFDIDRAFWGALNNIYAGGGTCISLQVSLVLPAASEEADLKGIMNRINELCAKSDIFVSGGHTEVSKHVDLPILSITSLGYSKSDLINSKGARVGDDIVVTKYAGLEGSCVIARIKEKELKKRFSDNFIDRVIDYSEMMDISKEAVIARDLGASAMHDASTGGIFGALWEIGEASLSGMEVDLLSIPLKQETVEICEEYGLNPYELMSGGCLVITVPNGKRLVEKLNCEDIEATIIGKITSGNDRVLIINDEKRFLEPRRNEELLKVIL